MGYAQIDHPLPREEPPRIFDPEWRRDRLVTVCDFGARGAGLHDETECFVAYNVWFRHQLNEPDPQRIWTIGRQGYYWLTKTLDWTNYDGVIFDCGPAIIKSKIRGGPAIDARGTSNSTIEHVYIESIDYPDQLASAAIYVGGLGQHQNVINFCVRDISIDGNYDIAPIVNYGTGCVFSSEISQHVADQTYEIDKHRYKKIIGPEMRERQVSVIDLGGVTGNIGNKMISLMAALSIQSRVANCELANFELKEWNISFPIIPIRRGRVMEFSGERLMNLEVEATSDKLRRGEIRAVYIRSYAQHFANFREVDFYRRYFPSPSLKLPSFDERYIIISVRGNEILKAVHNDYTLIPIDFYEERINELGMIPVFVGQIEPNLYMDRLRARFPSALYIESGGPMYDFELMRSAHNIIVSVSTFSWLAAWFSYAKIIVLPLTGFYNSAQCPDTDLLPLDDPRYHFFQFPINYAVPVDQHVKVHESMTGRWRRITPDQIRAIRRSRPMIEPSKGDFLQMFDEDFYQDFYPDIKAAVARGRLRSGFDHFVSHGFAEGRYPCQFDPVQYCMDHPDAALLVSEGVYRDMLHHFVAVNVGRERDDLSLNQASSPTRV